MRSIHVLFLSTIFRPDETDSNLYSYIFNRFLFTVFLDITVINAVINRHFGGVLGGVGNDLNTVIIYLFLYAGTRFSKGRIFFLLPSFL